MTTYLSVDVEADGPIPGPFSMLSFGVVAFDESGKEIDSFTRNLELLPDAKQHPATMAWWAKNQAAYDRTRQGCVWPVAAMTDLDDWMRKLPGKLTFVGYPASYDFLFLYWYLINFCDFLCAPFGEHYESPFGFQALDIKTLAMIPLGLDFRAVSKRKMPREWFVGQPDHTHDPLDDARGQGMLFFRVLQAATDIMLGHRPPPGWQWHHEHQAKLLERDGLMCEEHLGREWPHDDCAGPGMTWGIEGKEAVLEALRRAGPMPDIPGIAQWLHEQGRTDLSCRLADFGHQARLLAAKDAELAELRERVFALECSHGSPGVRGVPEADQGSEQSREAMPGVPESLHRAHDTCDPALGSPTT